MYLSAALPIDSRMAEIAHLTDVITIVLVSIVIITNIVAIVLLIMMHKQTKRPSNPSMRYKTYRNTIATVVSVTKVAYYIKRYEKPDTDEEDDKKKKNDLLPSSGGKKTTSVVEKYSGSEIVYRSPDEVKKNGEVKKYRYKVLYEFTPEGTENLYTGECYVYSPNTLMPGDIIEITYKPDDPMINFTDYSLPAGISAK